MEFEYPLYIGAIILAIIVGVSAYFFWFRKNNESKIEVNLTTPPEVIKMHEQEICDGDKCYM
jgi:flagellar basal body-associated protein FliL